jgi:hypothetical protein
MLSFDVSVNGLPTSSSSPQLHCFGMLCIKQKLLFCTQWQDKLPVDVGGCFTLCKQEPNHTSHLHVGPTFQSYSHCHSFARLHMHSRGCSQQEFSPPSACSGAIMWLFTPVSCTYLYLTFGRTHIKLKNGPVFERCPFFSKIPRL